MVRAMDEIVLRSMAKWPDVPEVYGWLALDRRGNWLIRSTSATQSFEKIGNSALREFIGRNYQPDAQGRWFFQNGPQRVFVKLAYTPFVVHFEGNALLDQCGRPFGSISTFQDEEGSVLLEGTPGIALLDDRDLERYSENAASLPRVRRAEVPKRFGFVAEPDP